MRRRFVVAAVVLLAGGIALDGQPDTAADLPYAGKWKLNVAKSDFGETTVTFARSAAGEMQLTAAGQSYTFRADGKDYAALFGRTATWKQIDDHTWETVNKQDGKPLSTETTRLSTDGKTLTVNAKGPKPAGGTFEQTTVYERVDGGPGLVGKWKTKNVETSAPTVLELVPSGSDGLTINIPDFKIASEVKFDGKDYPAVVRGTARLDAGHPEGGPTFVRPDRKTARQTALQAVIHRLRRRQDIDGNRRPDRRQRKIHGCLRPPVSP